MTFNPFTTDACGTRLTLVAGDDYFAADGRAINFSLDGTVLPDLTGAAAWLVLDSKFGLYHPTPIAGVILTPTGSTRSIQFELPGMNTRQLWPTVEGAYRVECELASGNIVSSLDGRGALTVLAGRQGGTACFGLY